MMLYKITQQYGRGTETAIAAFRDVNDAKIFANAKLAKDANVNTKTTYRLYEGTDLIEEMSESPASVGGTPQSLGSGAGQKTSFQPTPFNAAPRPPGMPHNWIKDEEEKSKK